jgi:hypothetical protein
VKGVPTKILVQFSKTVTDGLRRSSQLGVRSGQQNIQHCTQQATHGFSPPVRRDDATRA